MPDAEIVFLTADTASALTSIAEGVFDNEIKPEQLDAFVADPRHVMALAIQGAQVVGMASGVEYFHPDKPPQMWINEVGVGDDYRRRGIGRRLVAALIDEARRRGCDCAWLGTDTDNMPAQACFRAADGRAAQQPFLMFEWDL